MLSNVLYVATVASHICQFHLPYLKDFRGRGCTVHVAARDNLAEKNGLALQYADRHIEIPFQRSPFDRRNLTAYRQLRDLLRQEHYDLIVCNTPVGGILTRLAARKSRKQGTKVVYIAHGFHFYKGAPKKNWLLYYPIEKMMAPLCDTLITITKEDYALASKKFRTNVAHIHGIGVSADRYHPVTAEEAAAMRQAESLADSDFVILCTGELNKNKDQQTLIRAAAQLKDTIPELKILLAGNGPLEGELKALVADLGLEDTVRFLGYRTDLERVVPAVDLVVSCSRREGMPLNVIEAMLCGKPVIAAENRGTRELIRHGENGLLFPHGEADTLADGILRLTDSALRDTMHACGLQRANAYTVSAVRGELERILHRNES